MVFRQTLPSARGGDHEGGFFRAGEWRKNANNDSAALYSILDEIDTSYRDADGLYEFKLVYPGCDATWHSSRCGMAPALAAGASVRWRQGHNPMDGVATASSEGFKLLNDLGGKRHLTPAGLLVLPLKLTRTCRSSLNLICVHIFTL